MIKKFVLPVFIILGLLLSSCSPSSGQNLPTTLATQVAPTQTAPAPVTPLPPTATLTSVPPTATATPPPENPIQHFASGQEFTVTSIHMVDTTTGWAIGSLVGVGDHVLYTADGASTWKDVTPPEKQALNADRKFAIGFFQDAKTAWVTFAIFTGNPVPTEALVWRTSDGGLTWQASQPVDLTGISEIYVPSDLQLVAGQAGWLLVHVGAGMNHDYVVIYRTADGGASWSRVIDPYTDGGIQSCTKTGMLFTDATHGWLTGDCNGVKAGALLYKTIDAGSTWQVVNLPEPPSYPGLFSDESMVACGSYDPFFFSNDTGHVSVNCHDFSGTQITYSYYLFTTQDGGNTWTSTSYPGLGIYFFSIEVGWTSSMKIQQTTDGGKTWKPISDVSWTPEMDFVSEQVGWAVATTGEEVALVKTDNGGAKWTMLIPTIRP
ncbi:MAG TPA: hypothetical protein VF831_07505 [Anaerolineales bacterium]